VASLFLLSLIGLALSDICSRQADGEKKLLLLFFYPLLKQFEKSSRILIIFSATTPWRGQIFFYANKMYFPRVLAILYLPCTF
jgi:hypothetical protein